MKRNFSFLAALLIAVGCAQAPRSPQLVQYQAKSAQILKSYAGSVSRGFGRTSTATRGFMDGAGSAYDPSLYQNWQQTNGNLMAKQDIYFEVEDCKDQIAAIPKNCNNLGFMISSLSRCLDRVVSNQNPIYTYAYRQLDRPAQQHWTYLLDWRTPRSYQDFRIQDHQKWNPYVYSGWIPGSVTY